MKRQSICIVLGLLLTPHIATANAGENATAKEGCENLTAVRVFCAKGRSGTLDVRGANCVGQSDQILVRYSNGMPIEVVLSAAEKDSPLEEWARLTRKTAIFVGKAQNADADTNEFMDAAIARAEADARNFGCR